MTAITAPATVTVTKAPPFATIQDLGRTGFRDSGVPVSGLADRDSGLALNALLGNDPNAAMIEWALAGGTLRFDGDATIAIAGANAVCTVSGRSVEAMNPLEVSGGQELCVSGIVAGRFLLIAVRGGVDVPVVLGSRSTLVSAAFGGFEGRRLRSGDCLPVGDLTVGAVARSTAPRWRDGDDTIRIVRGPQANLFSVRAWSALLGANLTVSRTSDRTGYRLDGVTMTHDGTASLPSEPTCVGAIQIPDGGAPIVIMHDGPTVGGYPKIAVIRSACISRFAQLTPGDAVKFVLDE
jgi:biotin-dependent carboxylase-like uncharacterized protein